MVVAASVVLHWRRDGFAAVPFGFDVRVNTLLIEPNDAPRRRRSSWANEPTAADPRARAALLAALPDTSERALPLDHGG